MKESKKDLLTNGNGSFSICRFGWSRVSRAVALLAFSVLAALAVPSRSLAQVQLPSGPPYMTVAPTNSASVAIGDMNGDGNKDVVIGVYPSPGDQNGRVQIVPGDGQGGFGTPREFSTGPVTNPGNVVLGDLNGDGKLDVVVVNHGSGAGTTISVLFGDGAGNLSSPVIYDLYVDHTIAPTPVYAIALGDIDGDGKLDIIATTNGNQPFTFNTQTSQVWVLRNNGAGGFTIPAGPVWTKPAHRAETMAADVAVGDLDGDGHLDIVVTSGYGWEDGPYWAMPSVVTVLFGDGIGAFPSSLSRVFPDNGGGYPSAALASGLAIADIDGDGKPDVVVAAADNGGQDWRENAGAVTVFRNTGARTFDAGSHYGSPPRTAGLAIGDLNNDGHPDLVVTGAPVGGDIYYLLNDGSGAFGPGNYLPLPGAFAIAAGDLTNSGPGTVDIVAGSLGLGTKLLKNGPATPPDTTAPLVTGTINPLPNSAGWNNSNVTVSWAPTDPESGISSSTGCGPTNLTSETQGTQVTCTATNGAGLTTTQSVTIKIDKTAPTITAARSPLANSSGWNNTNVTASFSGSDAGSGIANCTGNIVLLGEGAGQSAQGTCTDNAGNISAPAVISSINIDKTAPAITGSRAPLANTFGWNNTSVTVSFSCSDGLSGVASCSNPVTLQAEGIGQSVSGTVMDAAGNSASASVGGINIDRTPPTIGPVLSPPAINGWNNTNVTVTFVGADGLSGLNTITGPVSLTAETPGMPVNGVATDKAGNSSNASVLIKIDKTPPEAMNRLDPVTKSVVVLGVDSLSGVPAGPAPGVCTPISWGGEKHDGEKDDDKGNAQRCTFKITDAAGNLITLVEDSKRGGDDQERGESSSQITVRVVSFQYNNGPVIAAPKNTTKKFEWSVDKKTGALTNLEQNMTIGTGKAKRQVEAKWDRKKNQTSITDKTGDDDDKGTKKVVKDGQVLLIMQTQQPNQLLILY